MSQEEIGLQPHGANTNRVGRRSKRVTNTGKPQETFNSYPVSARPGSLTDKQPNSTRTSICNLNQKLDSNINITNNLSIDFSNLKLKLLQ